MKVLGLVLGLLLRPVSAQTATDSFDPAANGRVLSLAVQPDGKVLAGGAFTIMASQPRFRIARLSVAGELDSSFNPGADPNDSSNFPIRVSCLAVQVDGKIIVGGNFTNLTGETRSRIGRLSADGTLDQTFDPQADDWVRSLTIQQDGGILLGGDFTEVAGQARSHIARLNADGSLDASFNPGANGAVLGMAVQPDGSMVVGGAFTVLAGQPRHGIGRLSADGALDPVFNPGANQDVHCLIVQPDGKILVGGPFVALAGQPQKFIARLNADGTLDGAFNPVAHSGVQALALLADGNILAGTAFSTLGWTNRGHLGRLHPDGSVDTTFDPGPNAFVYSLAVQADGDILVGGDFTTLGGQPRKYIGRITSGSPALQTLAINTNGTAATWSRSGSAPEIEQVTFEASTDGVNYTLLGGAERVSGGWQLTGLSLPPDQNFLLRARGRATGGNLNGSSGLIESVGQFFFAVKIPGARAMKEEVLAELIAVGATVAEPEAAHQIEDAIKHLTASLDSDLWIDESHLQPKPGNRAFEEENAAVQNVCQLISARKSPVPAAVLQGFVDRIVQADRLLASVAIQDAINAGASPKKLAGAEIELAKGDREAALSTCGGGIEHYRNAWKRVVG